MNPVTSRKLGFTLAAVSTLVAVLLFLLLSWQPQQEARRGFESKSQALAELVAYNVRSAAEFGDREAAHRALETAARERSVAYLAIHTPDRAVLATTDAVRMKELPAVLAEKVTTGENETTYQVVVPIVAQNGAAGWLQGGFHTLALKETVSRTRWLSASVAIFVALVVFALLYGILSRAQANRILIDEIGVTASKVRSSSASIIQSCNDLAANAIEQSSAIEETRRTMVALLEAATRIAESSREVFENADHTARGTQTAAAAIGVLTEQAQKIGEISEVIRSISDKSDLLALNASLEGTRAGEAGKSFALVAVEMRRLAESVTEAAREIKQLSGDIRAASDSSVSAVQEGRELAGRTSESAREITQVTRQQREATEQVTRSMEQVNELLVRSAQNTSQAEASARELAGRADELTLLTSRFSRARNPERPSERG